MPPTRTDTGQEKTPGTERRRWNMEEKNPSAQKNWFHNNRNAVAELLKNPSLCSEALCRRTMERASAQGFNIRDVQHVIETHLGVLREAIQRGEQL
jgi:hypothetical protein